MTDSPAKRGQRVPIAVRLHPAEMPLFEAVEKWVKKHRPLGHHRGKVHVMAVALELAAEHIKHKAG